MRRVPEIYRLRHQGVTDKDFARMATSPSSPQERELGSTYRHLFSTSPSAQPLRASFVEGRGLVVDAGQHRVLAAQMQGVSFLPVHVSAPDETQLNQLQNAFEQDVRLLAPELSNLVDVQRAHDENHYPEHALERLRYVERHPGPERLEPERESGWRYPERER
jgi:hypothetical protein